MVIRHSSSPLNKAPIPFKCPKCTFKTRTSQDLAAHIKEKHENPEEEAAQAVLEKINEVTKDNKKRWTAQRRRPAAAANAPPCTCKKPGCGERTVKTDPGTPVSAAVISLLPFLCKILKQDCILKSGDFPYKG